MYPFLIIITLWQPTEKNFSFSGLIVFNDVDWSFIHVHIAVVYFCLFIVTVPNRGTFYNHLCLHCTFAGLPISIIAGSIAAILGISTLIMIGIIVGCCCIIHYYRRKSKHRLLHVQLLFHYNHVWTRQLHVCIKVIVLIDLLHFKVET